MSKRSPAFISRRRFLASVLAAGTGSVVLGAAAYEGCYSGSCVVRRARVAGPAGWAGKTALFLTDIHYGDFFGPKEAAALHAEVRAQKPDLVLLGGDLGNTPETDLAGFFAGWAPGCPAVFAPGNHDLEIGKAGSPALRQAAAAGVTVLCNREESWNGLGIIGLSSALRFPQKMSLLRRPGFKLLLAHEPDVWDRYGEADVLQLAGHSHGGQIRVFGRALRLPPLGRKYPLGQYTEPRNRTLIVSAGIGCSGIPARLDCPPEIYRLEFV